MMFEASYPIDRLKPASYNPRRISETEFSKLRESIRALGAVKPVIVSQGTIIAGHQRTKAMRAEGLENTAVHLLGPVSVTEEIRFNQIHNGSDLDESDELKVRVPAMDCGWQIVPAREIRVGNPLARGAVRRKEILRLLAKHGPWGGAVALPDGRVISSADYAACCQQLGMPLHLMVIGADLEDVAKRYLSASYGVYSYDHLPRTTWAQALAQMNRLNGGGNRELRSRTYEHAVLPHVTKKERILDFGAGKLAYVKRLSAAGYQIRGLEFYLQRNGKIAFGEVQRHIDRVLEDLRTHGPYDVVVCDSVLNSVDSVAAEEAVLLTLSALCRKGGKVIFSGRSLDSELTRLNNKTCVEKTHTRRQVNFLDGERISAIYSRGVWRYQKFHGIEHIRELTERFIGKRYEIRDAEGRELKSGPIRTTGWSVVAINERPSSAEDLEKGLRFEFNLPLPGGKRYGRGDDIVAAVPWLRGEDA
ncbi:ParB N-terminal domain-containing protein [Luteolibacter pohnpeiensis]|uniref:ParB N-terminal domain-containing protein n=1 Tax=Luteolibacter pohnpeiensis TaxID=454153 RepID=A0A934VSS4_9BACT|nr:ParB N-terminal domain-containing protein [Luteolibacter pohnpeiensis]MBK1884631.1 ParB N-terminal domain-containing protein [Luteolibacter pohnpeiensis]